MHPLTMLIRSPSEYSYGELERVSIDAEVNVPLRTIQSFVSASMWEDESCTNVEVVAFMQHKGYHNKHSYDAQLQ